jgi:OmpA-OmpF porin, OOP family
MARNKVVSTVVAGAVSAVLGTLAAPALADKNSGFYVGGGAGQSSLLDLSNICNNRLPAGGITVTSCDNKGLAWKGFAGYQFIRYFGVELGYYEFGKGTIKTSTGGQIEYKARGPYAGIVVTAPMTDQLSILARAGALRWSTKFNPDASTGLAGASDNGINGSFGLGLEYMFNDHFGVRGEFERFVTVGDDATTGQTNINVWTVSGLFRF